MVWDLGVRGNDCRQSIIIKEKSGHSIGLGLGENSFVLGELLWGDGVPFKKHLEVYSIL